MDHCHPCSRKLPHHVLSTAMEGEHIHVKGVENVSSMSRSEDLIVYTLFNKHERKYRKRKPGRCRRKVVVNEVAEYVKCNVVKYKNINLTLNLRTYYLKFTKE